MFRKISLLTFLLAFAVQPAFAQEHKKLHSCDAEKVLRAGTELRLNFIEGQLAGMAVIKATDDSPPRELDIRDDDLDGQIVLDQNQVNAISGRLIAVDDRKSILLALVAADGSFEAYPFRLETENQGEGCSDLPPRKETESGEPEKPEPTEPEELDPLPPPSSSQELSDCSQRHGPTLGQTISGEIEREGSGRGFTLIVFPSSGGSPCYLNRDYGVYGDPIYVAILDNNSLESVGVEYSTCAIEQAGPTIFASDTGALVGGRQTSTFTPVRFVPRRCFNPSVDITVQGVKRVGDAQVKGRFLLSQHKRYQATLQLGVSFSDRHENAFGLRPDDENPEKGRQRIFNAGPVDEGPEYTMNIVLYSLPRQLSSAFSKKKTFHGRDVVNDQGFADRLGVVVAVGLDDPGKRFGLGLSFELVAGINLIGLYEFTQVKELDGFAEGDLFEGTADEIPIKDVWVNDFALGVSLDLRYVTELFRR